LLGYFCEGSSQHWHRVRRLCGESGEQCEIHLSFLANVKAMPQAA
jgi:hypothetical protein